MPESQLQHVQPALHRNNLLLASLSVSDARLIQRYLMRVSFRPGDIVASPDKALDMAYFPETMVVSFREALGSDHRPEVGMVGREGMVGWPLLLGCDRSSLMCVAQTSGGTALAIRALPLTEACHISATLHASLLRYVHNFMLQMACTIVSTADTIERRVARWVLMLHDRTDGDIMALTHDQIGAALNVRRASVTDCLHLLEGDAILKCTRGRMIVRDRVALERVAGPSYGAPEAHHAAEVRQHR